MPEKETRRTLDRSLAEPVAALVTIPCSYVGPWAWEIAWLTFIPVAQILKRIQPVHFMNEVS